MISSRMTETRVSSSSAVVSRHRETRKEPSMISGGSPMASSTWLRCPLAQAGPRGSLQRAADDNGLARLRVHAHPDDKVSVFFEQFIKVFHKRFLSAARNGMVVLP